MNEEKARPEPQPPLGPFQALARVAGIFHAPLRTVGEIRAQPNWVFPLLLSMLFSFMTAAVLFSRPEWPGILVQALSDAQPEMGELERVKALASMRIAAWMGALAAPVFGNLILASLLWVVITARQGKTTFLHLFSFQLHAQMVTLLPQALASVRLLTDPGVGDLTQGQGPLPTTLAYYLPQDVGPSLRAAAGAFDIFGLWYWGLVVIGLAGLAGVSIRRFLMPVAALWALGLLIRATFPYLGGVPS